MLIPTQEEPVKTVPVELHSFGSVGEFAFVDQEGRTFSSEALEGKVWLAGFVFTSCAAECPILTRKMMEVRERLGKDSRAAYVSFSVDPQTDTPERLREYAASYGPTGDWTLLTGEADALDALIKEQLLLPVAEDFEERRHIASTHFVHSNKLIVVDEDGAIRYHTDGLEPDAVERLAEAMRRLM